MEYITFPSLSNLLFFFSTTPVTEPVTSPEPETDDEPETNDKELLLLLNQQKQINDLVYVCDLDNKGKLNGRWVKACSL